MPNRTWIAALSAAALLLVSCGGEPSANPSSSPEGSEDQSQKAAKVLEKFTEAVGNNNATVKVEEVEKGTSTHVMDYSFFGEKAQIQNYTEEMKAAYSQQYPGETLSDGGILINGDQGAFSFTLDEEGDVTIGSPLGMGSTLQELSAYGPAMLGDAELYLFKEGEESESGYHFDSRTDSDGTMTAASYWLPVMGLRSSYASMTNDFDLYLSEDLSEVVCSIELVDDSSTKITYKATMTNIGTTVATGKLAAYLASPDYLPTPSDFESVASEFLAENKGAGAKLPFPTGVTAQYDESTYEGVLQITNAGVNLVKSYSNQLQAAGFESHLVENSNGGFTTQWTISDEAAEDDLSYLDSALTVIVGYSQGTSYILVNGMVDYRDLTVANQQLLAWNDGDYNKKYALDLGFTALPASSAITSVYSNDLTSTMQSYLESYGMSGYLYFAWGASVKIDSKEDAIAWAGEALSAQVEAGFTNDGTYTMDGNGYAYCYKAETTYSTEAGLKFSLDLDDNGEYSGYVSIEAYAGYYYVVDALLQSDPNA